jgi:hypothetical protein
VSIQGAPQRRPFRSFFMMSVQITAGVVPTKRVSFSSNDPSLTEQIAPVLTFGLGGNGIAGVSCAVASSLNDRLDRIVAWYDLKAGHGRERWL